MSSDFICLKIKTKVFGHKHELKGKSIRSLLRTFTNGHCQLDQGRQKNIFPRLQFFCKIENHIDMNYVNIQHFRIPRFRVEK